MAYPQVVASRIAKYKARLERDGNDADLDMSMFWIAIGQLIDAAFSGGGGGSTSSATITQGINDAVDIDAIISRLVSIDSKTYPVGGGTIANSQAVSIATDQIVPINNRQINGTQISVGVGASNLGTQRMALSNDSIVSIRSDATPIAQSTIILAAGGTGNYIIPAAASAVTICITSGGLVHYTEDNTAPTASSCWFAGGSKEIWDQQIPAGSNLRLLAVSAATVSIQVRVRV